MDLLWQQIIIALALLGAVVYLIRWGIRRKQRRSGICTGCQCRKNTVLDRPEFKRP